MSPANSWLTRGVLGIGLASLFSDWGHEAATAILPAFLASLGAPAFALGVIEGVSDGLSSFAKLAGGWIADRPQLRKPTGIIGYFATGLSTFAYAFAQSWPAILVMRALGWVGRGSRGPSRDTLLADCVAPEQQGRAFGFERAMDTIGAVLGPLCATALLGALGARRVLHWTLLPGLAAGLAFALLAPKGIPDEGHRAPSFASSFAQLPKTYWHFLAGVFARGTNPDAALWSCARFRDCRGALHFSQFCGCGRFLSGWSARRSHRQTRATGRGLSFRCGGVRGIYF
jgi:MFS family permease